MLHACGRLNQSQPPSVREDDDYRRKNSGYYDQFGILDQSSYEEEYYVYDSTSYYDSDSIDEELPSFDTDLAGTSFANDSLDKTDHLNKEECPEDTKTEDISKRSILSKAAT